MIDYQTEIIYTEVDDSRVQTVNNLTAELNRDILLKL